jgi:hypothetical protein
MIPPMSTCIVDFDINDLCTASTSMDLIFHGIQIREAIREFVLSGSMHVRYLKANDRHVLIMQVGLVDYYNAISRSSRLSFSPSTAILPITIVQAQDILTSMFEHHHQCPLRKHRLHHRDIQLSAILAYTV